MRLVKQEDSMEKRLERNLQNADEREDVVKRKRQLDGRSINPMHYTSMDVVRLAVVGKLPGGQASGDSLKVAE